VLPALAMISICYGLNEIGHHGDLMRDELGSPISLSYCCIMQCLPHCEMASFSAAGDSKSNGSFMDFLVRGYEDFDEM
jgi:hypothetical protein